MALEWWDGFDQYGAQSFDTPKNILDGVYAEAEFGVGGGIVTTNPRTGSWNLRISSGVNNAGVRRVLTAPRTAFGLAYGFSISKLPTNPTDFGLLQARNARNESIFTVTVGPSGDVYIRNGSRLGAPLAHYVNPAVFANAYQHFECKFDNGFKLWLNEVLIIDTPNVPTGILGGNVTTSVKIGNGGFPLVGASGIMCDIDDLFCYNLEGDLNNDQIGDCKVYTRFETEDLSPQDFTPSIGSAGYAMLDNVPPLDATEYLFASGTDLPKRSAFGLPDLPLEIVEVRGVMLSTRMFKLDAGSAKIVAGVVSEGVEAVSPEHAMSMAPIWYGDVFDADPATGLAWNLAAANNLTVFIERTE